MAQLEAQGGNRAYHRGMDMLGLLRKYLVRGVFLSMTELAGTGRRGLSTPQTTSDGLVLACIPQRDPADPSGSRSPSPQLT